MQTSNKALIPGAPKVKFFQNALWVADVFPTARIDPESRAFILILKTTNKDRKDFPFLILIIPIAPDFLPLWLNPQSPSPRPYPHNSDAVSGRLPPGRCWDTRPSRANSIGGSWVLKHQTYPI